MDPQPNVVLACALPTPHALALLSPVGGRGLCVVWGQTGPSAVGAGFTVLTRPLVLILPQVTSGLGRARRVRAYGRGEAGAKPEKYVIHVPQAPRGAPVTSGAPGTHPDFVILRLVFQILIKFLLGIEFNAIHF